MRDKKNVPLSPVTRKTVIWETQASHVPYSTILGISEVKPIDFNNSQIHVKRITDLGTWNWLYGSVDPDVAKQDKLF